MLCAWSLGISLGGHLLHHSGMVVSKVSSAHITDMILPPLTLDLGLLLISIGVVNLWRARQSSV